MEKTKDISKTGKKKPRRLSRKVIATLASACLVAGGVLAFVLIPSPTDKVVSSWNDAYERSLDPSFDPYSSADTDASSADSADGDSELPESFDLRYDWTDVDGVQRNIITPVKFQNPWMTCWAFSAIAASESSIWAELYNSHDAQAQYTPDFSERATAWFTYHAIPSKYADDQVTEDGETEGFYNETGNPNYAFDACGFKQYATSLFAAGVGPILEKEAPYKNDEDAVLVKKPAESDPLTQGDEASQPEYVPAVEHLTLDQIKAMTDEERQKLGFYATNLEGDGSQGPDATWGVDEDLWNDSCAELEGSNILPDFTLSDSDGAWIGVNWEGVRAAKEEIQAGRPVSVDFFADASKPGDSGEAKYIQANEDGTWAHWTYENESANHSVTIVGWDDSYSKDNFVNGGPEGDGAWIVKNSWGAQTEDFPNRGSWGTTNDEGQNTGFFYLSYYDRTLECAETFNYDVNSYVYEQPEYALDQYDFLVTNSRAVRTSEEPIYMANVFSTEDDQIVRTVACQTTAPNTEVTFELYLLDGDGNTGSSTASHAGGDLDLGSPVRTISQTFDYGGYHRITLDEDQWLPMRAGQRYAVKVTQRTIGEDGAATYYQNAAFTMKRLTDKQKEQLIEYSVKLRTTTILDEARQTEYDELIAQGMSEDEANAQADAFIEEYEQSAEFKDSVESMTESVTTSLQSYYVTVVNPGESYIGSDREDGSADWLDWTSVVKGTEKSGAAFDNLPIKAIANLADFADAESLQSLSSLIDRSDALLSECTVSEDGSDVPSNAKWVSREEHDALTAEAEAARALIEGLQGDFDQVTLDTPTQQAADEAIAALQKANDAYAAQEKPGR